MTIPKPVGAILFRGGKGAAADVVYAVAKWRDSTGRQNYRRVGRAWLKPDGDGAWRKRRGRPPEGYLDRRAAERAMDALIDETERELAAGRPNREATFADAVAGWRDYAEHTKRLKPASLRNYDAMLSPPGERPRRGGQRVARIMRAFGDRRIAEITTADIERFLRGLDHEGLAARNVNSNRQALANVFEYATRHDNVRACGQPCEGRREASRGLLKAPGHVQRRADPRARQSGARRTPRQRRPAMGEQT